VIRCISTEVGTVVSGFIEKARETFASFEVCDLLDEKIDKNGW
jgi:hypothetical protein